MPYVTKEEFFESGLPESFFEDVADATVDGAIAKASSIVDSYLRKRHTLPISNYGQDLKDATCALAAHRILVYRGFSVESRADMAIIDASKEARAWLRDVAKGLCEIEGVDATPDLDENGPIVSQGTENRSRLWTRGDC